MVADEPQLRMKPEDFEEFYAQTARPLKAYLIRLLQNAALADEVLQESYYKFLRSEASQLEERARKNYLFRIATNLVKDMYRSKNEAGRELLESKATAVGAREQQTAIESDVGKVLRDLAPRERELVWLAYVEGSTHREIADILGLKEVSIRPMLFRVRQKLAGMLKSIGYCERMVM